MRTNTMRHLTSPERAMEATRSTSMQVLQRSQLIRLRRIRPRRRMIESSRLLGARPKVASSTPGPVRTFILRMLRIQDPRTALIRNASQCIKSTRTFWVSKILLIRKTRLSTTTCKTDLSRARGLDLRTVSPSHMPNTTRVPSKTSCPKFKIISKT